jgi:hypothetical protein
VLERGKANFARRGETIELQWRDGVLVPLHGPSGILGSIERRNCQEVFLELLDKTTAEGTARVLEHTGRQLRAAAGRRAPGAAGIQKD